MTENCLHPDLSLAEEYARSGHSHRSTGVNVDAEGYVGSTPAMNAPGANASADYPDCHIVPAIYSFLPFAHVPDMVVRLIECLFKIEHDLLKRGGRLYAFTEISAARLIGSYNELRSTVGAENWIVETIRERCVKARLDDPRVPRKSSDRATEVLTSWSDTITRHFHKGNKKKLMLKKPSFNTALETMTRSIDLLSNRVKMTEQRFSEVIATLRAIEKTEELSKENARLIKENFSLLGKKDGYKKINNTLRKSLLSQTAMSPPVGPKKRRAVAPLHSESGEYLYECVHYVLAVLHTLCCCQMSHHYWY